MKKLVLIIFNFFPSEIILDNQKLNYKIIEILIWFGSIFQSVFLEKIRPRHPKMTNLPKFPKILPVRSVLSASAFGNKSPFPSFCSTDNTSQSLCQIFWPCDLSIFRLEINCDISVQNPVTIVILKKWVILSNFWKKKRCECPWVKGVSNVIKILKIYLQNSNF